MCTYNGEKYLREQLESIATQSLLPYELVICDDASTDKTVEIIEQFSASANFEVKLHVNDATLRVVKNFEKAIALCSGSIIALSDQDDVWLPNKLDRLEQTLRTSKSAFVFSDAFVVDEDLNSTGRLLSEYTLKNCDKELLVSSHGFSLLLKRSLVTGATMAFPAYFREMLLPLMEAGPLVHDKWISLLLGARGGFVYIDDPLMKYRQHPGQQIGVNGPRKLVQEETKLRGAALREMAIFYEGQVQFYQTAAARLKPLRQDSNIRASVELIELHVSELQKKVAHFLFRADMSADAVKRVPAAIRELYQLGYHRHSNGFLSFAKDVLR